MPRIWISALWVIMTSFVSCVAFANNPATPMEASTQQLTSKDIKALVNTLENKEKRQEFLKNLKSLQKAKEEMTPATGLEISEALSLEQATEWLINDYLDLIQEYGLNKSTVGTSITVAIIAAILLLFTWANRRCSYWFDHRLETVRERYQLASDRFTLYFKFQRLIGYILALVLLAYGLFEAFSLSRKFRDSVDLMSALQNLFTLFLIVFIFVSIWEFVNGLIEFAVTKNRRLQSARVQTLIPIIRNLMLFILLLMAIMVILSELGIDIVPLLAGAGVVGIAIGFGAQKLVKDFLNGFTIILEDLLQIGDIVTLADRTGIVERITIRKIQLRDLDGAVYTIPFGDVNIVSNLTKVFSYYLMEVGVAYRENTDEVCDYLKEIDEQLRESEEYGDDILEPLEILGVDKFANSAVVIKARIKTRPKQQWRVGREFNRRMKHLFDERNIEIPFPHQTIYFGEDKQGHAPNAPVRLVRDQNNDENKQDKAEHKNKAHQGKPGQNPVDESDKNEDED